MIPVDLINGRRTDQVYGTSKYTTEIFKRINDIAIRRIEYPQVGTTRLVDGAVKRTIYPFIVKKEIKKNSIKHITNQDLAFLLNLIDLRPSIVTCYDLIPVAYYHNNSMYWRMNLKGMQKADHIITISEFSKKEIIRLTGYPADRISVIYPGVDTERYFPRHNRTVLEQYGIAPEDPVIMYTGSEEPRKNLSLVLRALAHLKKEMPGIKFLKVGSPQMGGDRKSLENLITDLGLVDNVIFTGQVSEESLPLFFNAADLFVFPSYYEGFGLPPLEAMACGCPVIAADTTSLPEVVGDAGILIRPDDLDGITAAIHRMIIDSQLKNSMIANGLGQIKKFSWEVAADKTENVYLRFAGY